MLREPHLIVSGSAWKMAKHNVFERLLAERESGRLGLLHVTMAAEVVVIT